MTTLTFEPAEPITEVLDTVPPLDDIENPCDKCGREAGLTASGRRRKFCGDCKPVRGSSVKVTGTASQLAAQASKTLANLNNMMALVAGGLGLTRSMKTIFDLNADFEQAAYTALVTDMKLCRQILSVGETSAKIGLGIAYASMGIGVVPTLMEELRDKRAARMQDEEQG